MSSFDPYDYFAHEGDYPDLDVGGACARLAEAIRCRTIWQGDRTDWAEFDRLQALVRASFPHVMAAGTFELVGHSVLIRIPGSEPELAAAQLIAHQDVVPVAPGTEGAWEHDAFEGFMDETYVWGRGALDIKDMLMGELEATEYLLAHGARPRRTIVLAFGEDEEVRSTGATALAATMEERGWRSAWLLDEGTTTFSDGAAWGAPGCVLTDICLSQKGYLDLELACDGTPGHSSNPFGGTSLEHLCEAVARLSAARPEPELTPIASELFRQLSPHISSEPMRTLVADVDANADALARECAKVRELHPFVCTTMAVDQLEGGSAAANVMPGPVRAVVNLRLLPGTTADEVLALAERAVEGTGARVRVLHATPAGRVDSVDGPGYAELREAFEHFHPGAVVVPSIVCGGTDSVRYERVCGSILRVCPFRPLPEEEARIHGTNERIPKRVYAQGIRLLVRLLEHTVL